MDVLNRGGYPVKNAGYCRMECLKQQKKFERTEKTLKYFAQLEDEYRGLRTMAREALKED